MNKLRTVILLSLAAACVRPAAAEKLRIVTTIMPLAEFAGAVAGDRAEVRVLIPPGAGIHAWQPRPSDVIDVRDADLIVYIGPDLEPWMDDFLGSLPGKRPAVLEADKGAKMFREGEDEHPEEEGAGKGRHHHQGGDPHIWLDMFEDVGIVRRLAAALTSIDPASGGYYAANAARYVSKLEELDGLFRRELAPCRGRAFVVAGHNAFGYIARRYGLVQKSLYGLSPDSQLSPKSMMEIIDFCRANKVKAVFYENSVSSAAAETLSRETGTVIMALKTGHNPIRADLEKGTGFLDIMRENLASLKKGLGCY